MTVSLTRCAVSAIAAATVYASVTPVIAVAAPSCTADDTISSKAESSPTPTLSQSLSDSVDKAIMSSRESYDVPNVDKTLTTEDGMTVTVKKMREHLTRQSPVTANLFSHDVLVSLQGEAKVTGSPEDAVHTLTSGYYLGCQIDASEPWHLVATIPTTFQPFSPFFGFGNNTSVTRYEDEEETVPNWKKFGLPTIGVWWGFVSSLKFSSKIAFYTTVRPGRVVKVPLASYSFRGNKTTWMDFRNTHLYIDGCPGRVSLHSYVEFSDGITIPGHQPTAASRPEQQEREEAPTASPISFAGATQKLREVRNSALRPQSYDDSTTLKGIGESNSQRFAADTDTADSAAEAADDNERLRRELTAIGYPAHETLGRPYGTPDPRRVEGVKLTIHGAVRWMSTFLPQTCLRRDMENWKRNIQRQWEPVERYSHELKETSGAEKS